MRLIWGVVEEVLLDTGGVQRLTVRPDEGPEGKAVCYPALTGVVAAGDRVLLNTTAVDLGLGTGGLHFVVCRHGSGEGKSLDSPSGGHIMKLRYTPLQTDVLSVEAQESVHHERMVSATSLGGMPVVCCGLHSQVPLVAAAVKRSRPDARVAYCMTDGASLALPLSDLIRASVEADLVDATISCGQAFGGELEAINLHSGLLAARHVANADVAIAAIGPGVVGSGTPFGHGGIAQGEAINAVYSLGGVPVACLRVSFADERERHRGISHHSLAALTSIALAPCVVAVPRLSPEFADAIQEALVSARVSERHVVEYAGAPEVTTPELRGIRVTTMGRTEADDPAFFSAAYAAGEIASRRLPTVLNEA